MFRPDLKPPKQEAKPRKPLRRTAIKRKTFEEVKAEFMKNNIKRQLKSAKQARNLTQVALSTQSNGATPPKNYRTSNRRKKAIPKFSEKRAVQNKEYLKVRNEFLAKHRFCAVYNGLVLATEVHHMKGRRGKLLTDTRFFLPVSRAGHNFIENNPAIAYKQGWSLKRLEK